jgi:4-amino-4-deoxy-L-arabinose transferase-like glycosyltransferase
MPAIAWVALAALTALRLAVAAATPLTPDEAYYWVWSRGLAAGYYDHPPMVAYWAGAGVALFGDTALGVRLLAPVSAALATVLLVRAGTDLSGSRQTGLWAAILLNATLGFGLGAVSMTPDTPLALFWIAAIWASARLAATRRGPWFLVLGAAVGLALASKLSAAFLAVGVAAWIVLVPTLRPWLRTPWPYLGGLVSLAIFAPVIAWNATHGWAGFLRQGGRIGGFNPGNAPGYLAELVGGQIGMLTPIIFALSALGLFHATRAAWRERAATPMLLALLSLPPLLVFLQHTLTERVQGNWPAIVYPAAILAAAIWGAPRWRVPGGWLGAGLTSLVYIHAVFSALPIPPRLDPSMKRLAGWEDLAGQADQVRREQNAGFITADDYAVASMLAWRMPGITILVTQPRWSVFGLPRETPAGPGILIRSARLAERVETERWREQVPLGNAARGRNGVTAEEYRLYRVLPRAPEPLPRLPTARPGWSPR